MCLEVGHPRFLAPKTRPNQTQAKKSKEWMHLNGTDSLLDSSDFDHSKVVIVAITRIQVGVALCLVLFLLIVVPLGTLLLNNRG
jgi:hypothetical protein